MNPRGLSVETVGSGHPVVLTHGLGDRAETWDALWTSLTAAASTTRWDLRGHGRSETPSDTRAYSLEAAVADLEAVVAATSTPAVLVGHSLGGYISLSLALHRPELVGALVMISSGPGFRDPDARRRWNAYIDAVAERMPIPPAAARMAHQHTTSVIDRLAELRCPLIQVLGEHDERFLPGARYIARKLPKSELRLVPGAEHHPQRTHPSQVFAAVAAALSASGSNADLNHAAHEGTSETPATGEGDSHVPRCPR